MKAKQNLANYVSNVLIFFSVCNSSFYTQSVNKYLARVPIMCSVILKKVMAINSLQALSLIIIELWQISIA